MQLYTQHCIPCPISQGLPDTFTKYSNLHNVITDEPLYSHTLYIDTQNEGIHSHLYSIHRRMYCVFVPVSYGSGSGSRRRPVRRQKMWPTRTECCRGSHGSVPRLGPLFAVDGRICTARELRPPRSLRIRSQEVIVARLGVQTTTRRRGGQSNGGDNSVDAVVLMCLSSSGLTGEMRRGLLTAAVLTRGAWTRQKTVLSEFVSVKSEICTIVELKILE